MTGYRGIRHLGPVISGALIVICSVHLGCGSQHPTMVPVRGIVTYGGGNWPKPGVLYFTVATGADQSTGRPASATFDTHGNFVVGTWGTADGLMPGHYRVGVECWEVPPTMEGPGVSFVPSAFQSPATSGIELVIAPDDEAKSVSWDIPPRTSKDNPVR